MIPEVLLWVIVVIVFLTFIPVVVLIILNIISIIKNKQGIKLYSKLISLWFLLLIIILSEDYYDRKISNHYLGIKKSTNINVKSCKLIDNYMDFGINDGEQLITLDCTSMKNRIVKQMKKYEKLPVKGDLEVEMRGNNTIKKLLKIKSGYYHFIPGRNEEREINKYKIKTYYDYKFIMFDTDKNIFYYYTWDL